MGRLEPRPAAAQLDVSRLLRSKLAGLGVVRGRPRRATAPARSAEPLELVATPPGVDHAPGRIELCIDGLGLAEADVSLCGECQIGVIEHVRTAPPHRRRGFGWTVVAGALARGRGFQWSTTAVTDPQAQAFWHGIGFAPAHEIGVPGWCQHMREAWSQIP